MDEKLRTQLFEGAGRLGIVLEDEKLDTFLEYIALLARWNRRFNLTAIRDPAEMVAAHLLDSLSILPYVRGERVADVGSGAGLPGLPLAVVRPEASVLLIESSAKKTRFLNEAVRHLGLQNVTVWRGRAEDYRPSAAFDTVVVRAVAALAKLVKLAGHLVSPDGVMLAQKGRYPDWEIADLPTNWHPQVIRLDVPGVDKERHLVSLTHG